MKLIKYYFIIFILCFPYYLFSQIPSTREFTLPQSDSLFNSKIISLDNINLAAFWIENSKLYFSKTSDYGINWNPATHLLPAVTFNNTTFYTITVTNTGRIILIYKNNDVFITYSDDNGESFSNSQGINIPSGFATNNYKLTKSYSGDLYFSYTKGGSGVYYVKSGDNGESWGSEILVRSNGIARGIIASPDGKLHAFYYLAENNV
ncbi:MAG TPA: sialidase family protein, partial [Ignavibacteriaceae bacterium]